MHLFSSLTYEQLLTNNIPLGIIESERKGSRVTELFFDPANVSNQEGPNQEGGFPQHEVVGLRHCQLFY